MKTFQSTPITFIDQTDSRKLEVYITSNLPTVQIYNQNKVESEAYTPDWTEGDKLIISMDVFLDSRTMTTAEYNGTIIKWYENDVEINVDGDKRKIIIEDNILKSNAIITYTCEVEYQGIKSSSRITFTRVDTGLNGQKGADGTSVRILGTAKSADLVDDSTNYYTIVYDTGAIVAAELGDAYVLKDASSDLDGHLFVCALLNGGQDGATDYFIDAGQIQGPAGDPAKVITLIGSAQVFKVGKDGKTITPKAITITAHTVNIDDNSGIKWWYKYDTDVTWTEITSKIVQDTSGKTIISINNNNDVATVNVEYLNGRTSITLKTTYDNAEDALTLYKVLDGIDGEKGNPGDDAPIVFLSNEHISFVADANGETYGVQQNIPTNVVAYRGTTKVEPQIDLTLANASLPDGMSISIDEDTMASIKNITPDFSEIILKVSVDSGVNLGSTLSNNGMIPIQVTSPADVVLQLNWTKVNAGTNGVDGKTSYLHIAYATSSDGKSGFSVSDSVSKTYIGQYTDYTEDDSTDPTKYKWTLIKGDKGDQGVQGPKGNDGQQLYTWIKYADTPTSGMSNDPAGKTYIGLAYNKTTATESSTYSDYMWSLIKGETGPTGPKGDNGQQYYTWIKYADNASGANMSDSPTGKLYIGLAYNKTTSTESNVTTDYTWALFKGDKGETGTAGADAYTVLLTNESHVFAGSTSTAIASSATTQVLSYKGTTSQSATIVSVNGVAASTASTATGIAGLSFQCNALSGTSPTITFTCTTAFVSPNGTIPIVIKVGSISITKMFTYSIAFKGATGGTGPASSSYWLISNASAVQKTSNGDVLFTPATLTFTGKVKTGSGAPTDYAGRWILAYSTDGSTYTNSYTSTANETTASIAASDSYKAVRARMYLAGGTTTLLDEQIVPFVSDGEVGPIGPTGDDAVTFQVYSSNGYALSTSVPTITLQTFAYIGDVEITAGATFQWYRHNGTDWVSISGATNSYLNVSRDDVAFSNNYRCIMQFNGAEYVGVVTIEDKNDENKVFASKPYNYFAGDLWIVGTDYTPPSYTVGTMLRAEHTNTGYIDSDWVPATKYDDEIKDLRDTVDSYKQYFSVNSTNGLQIGNSSINNDILTTDTVNAANINADLASLESLDIIGKYSGSTMLQAPVINLGKFSIVIESNGSLSIVANT